jgi:hypothetical protein
VATRRAHLAFGVRDRVEREGGGSCIVRLTCLQMICPHCTVGVNINFTFVPVGGGTDGSFNIRSGNCPECGRVVIMLSGFRPSDGGGEEIPERIVHPAGASRPVPSEVTEPFATDFRDAVWVLGGSAKASAALSRRILQDVLRTKAGVKPGTLDSEIQQVLDSSQLPSWLADDVDAVRTVGNFAAHPIKSQHTGEVVPVEPGEAEWLIDVVAGLFDFYFVEPVKAQQRRDALNAKLQEAGKPALKTSVSSTPSST